MICPRCQKPVRGHEGIKCGKCESGYHLQCVSARANMRPESGDKVLRWVCARCLNPASCTKLTPDPEAMQKAIHAITEKFELVNKIQLPKLNKDLLQIKSVTDRILKQNEDILLKIDELKMTNLGDRCTSTCNPPPCYVRRSRKLSPRRRKCDEQTPILAAEKVPRYRTRRRLYPLLKILLKLNRKLRRGRNPRR